MARRQGVSDFAVGSKGYIFPLPSEKANYCQGTILEVDGGELKRSDNGASFPELSMAGLGRFHNSVAQWREVWLYHCQVKG
jgi:hypothetical protein